ncbi:RDD family protein [Thaumasiovibrio sp. DFM-14]|uniref:RDD family protein n=1 Tax=Thaumasiovibrio sp. DFM-14 TaxID=3384792 RepID=UPI0039A3F087
MLVKEASLLRRAGAWLYDGLVVCAVLMLAAGVAMAIIGGCLAIGVLTIDGYLDASDYLNQHPIARIVYPLYLLVVMALFYAFFWCRGGQTLGMRAWRLHVINQQGLRITWTQALIRMATSAFGLGNLIALIDPNNRSFQDHMAQTHVIYNANK